MKCLKNSLLWLWLLTKRLYKKPTFLVILILIPLLVLCYSASVREESGMVTVVLCAEAPEPLTEQIFDTLQNESQLLRYVLCDSAQQAETLVRTGKADTAWVFSSDLQACVDAFIADPTEEQAFVRVIQREDNVALMLARERLNGVLYTHMARSFYLHYIRDNFPELQDLPDETLLTYYDHIELTDELFTYDSVQASNAQEVHYLMSPIRGLLAVIVVLGSLATAMYYCRDMTNGTFQWVSQQKRFLPELGCQMVSSLNMCVIAFTTLLLIGMAGNLLSELVVLVLYSLCTAVFAMLLRRVLGTIRAIGTALPLLIVAMLLLCPVFFDLGVLRPYQFLLPPTYYINAVYNEVYLLYMVAYTLICSLLYLVLGKVLKRA